MENYKIFIIFLVLLCGLLSGLYIGFYIQALFLPGRRRRKRDKKNKEKHVKKKKKQPKPHKITLLDERAIECDSYTNFLCNESGDEISKVVHNARKTQDGKYTGKI